MFSFSVEYVLRSLFAIVRQFGEDYVNPSFNSGCYYAERDETGALVPSCIVGQFFHREGILGLLTGQNTEDSKVFVGNSIEGDIHNACATTDTLRDYLVTVGVQFSEGAWRILANSQSLQDGGNTWGVVLDHAANLAVREGLVAVPDLNRERVQAALNL